MSIFPEIKNSIYSPEYYETIYHRPFGLSMRYFWKLVLLLSLAASALVSLIFVPHVYRFVTTLFDEAAAAYPAKLEFSVKAGEASSNVAEPFFIEYPPRLKSALTAADMQLPERFITVATRDQASLDLATRYNTLILIGGDGVVNTQAEPGQTYLAYGTTSDFTLTKAQVVAWHDVYRPYFKLIPPLLALFIFAFFVVVLGLNLLYLLVAAPFIMLVGRHFKLSLTYWQAYQYGLHAITAAILIDIILLVVPGGLPWAATLAIMLVAIVGVTYLNLRGARQADVLNQ